MKNKADKKTSKSKLPEVKMVQKLQLGLHRPNNRWNWGEILENIAYNKDVWVHHIFLN